MTDPIANSTKPAQWSAGSRPYSIDSSEECDRLERQGLIARIDGHLAHLKLPKRALVLECGCGSGSMSRLIARTHADATVVGVDYRQQYLDYAAALAGKQGLANVTFRQADVFALPFPDASFDVVWTKYLLQWLKEPKRALAEIKRVIKPGGMLVSCDFDGFITEHFPISPALESRIGHVITAIVDTNTGRKIAPYLIELGFADVNVAVETDHVFTIVGKIDPERRQNWVTQWTALGPRLIEILGSDTDAKNFVEDFLRFSDDPATCTFTSLYFTRGTVSV